MTGSQLFNAITDIDDRNIIRAYSYNHKASDCNNTVTIYRGGNNLYYNNIKVNIEIKPHILYT